MRRLTLAAACGLLAGCVAAPISDSTEGRIAAHQTERDAYLRCVALASNVAGRQFPDEQVSDVVLTVRSACSMERAGLHAAVIRVYGADGSDLVMSRYDRLVEEEATRMVLKARSR